MFAQLKPRLAPLTLFALGLTAAVAADRPQWGQRYSRNQVSPETGLPATFDPATGKNIKWSVPLGTQCYSTPVIGNGKILIGVNNGAPRDPKHKGDRGVLFCLNESDGSFCWQLVVPKLAGDVYLDWPRAGICSPATVESNRVYIVSNRGEAVCLDIEGLANGNDGPYRGEARHMTPAGSDPLPLGPVDADIIWLYDMVNEETGVYPHDSAHSSILIRGLHLYLNTGNGVDNTHGKIRSPDAPSLIVLDKATGELVARDDERIGPRIFHCTWSSPALGAVNGSERVFFCGGDGVCYAFAPAAQGGEKGQTLNKTWWYDCDPDGPKENVSRYMRNRKESPTTIMGMPVYRDGRVYLAAGGDIWWGKREAWLHCIDASGTGDISTGGRVWSYALNRHSCSTPAIHDGLAYVVDWGETLHCVDIETGKACWTHDIEGRAYASPLVVDGKVYATTMTSRVWALSAGREKEVLGCTKLESPISSTPVAANGVLYIATFKRLYAVAASPES